jgi:hypothetical protein
MPSVKFLLVITSTCTLLLVLVVPWSSLLSIGSEQAASSAILWRLLDASERYTASVLSNHSAVLLLKDTADTISSALDKTLSLLVSVGYGQYDVGNDALQYADRARKLVLDFRMLQMNASRLVRLEQTHVASMILDLPIMVKLLGSNSLSAAERSYAERKLYNMQKQWQDVRAAFVDLVGKFDSAFYKANNLRLDVDALLASYQSELANLKAGPSLQRTMLTAAVILVGVAVPSTQLLHLSTLTAALLSSGASGLVELYRRNIHDPDRINRFQELIVIFERESQAAGSFTLFVEKYAALLNDILTEIDGSDIGMRSMVSCSIGKAGATQPDDANTSPMDPNYCLQQFLSETIDALKRVHGRLSSYTETEAHLSPTDMPAIVADG